MPFSHERVSLLPALSVVTPILAGDPTRALEWLLQLDPAHNCSSSDALALKVDVLVNTPVGSGAQDTPFALAL